jgi:hypothetical protein
MSPHVGVAGGPSVVTMLIVPILGKFGTGTLKDAAGLTAGIATDQIG